jgi:hypothetical protein
MFEQLLLVVEASLILTFLIVIGALLHFKKTDLSLIFKGFSLAFCLKKILLGMTFSIGTLLLTGSVCWLTRFESFWFPLNGLCSGLSLAFDRFVQLVLILPANQHFLFAAPSTYQKRLEEWNLFLNKLNTFAIQPDIWALLALGLGLLFLFSYYGGAVTRIVAVEIATGNRPSSKEARSFVQNHFWSYFSPTFLIAFVFFFLYFSHSLLGVLAQNLGAFGQTLMALTLPLFFFFSFVMLTLIVGGVFTFPFSQVSPSIEGGDFFDTFSHSFNYFFTRPWHYFFYNLIATVYGVLVLSLFLAFALGMLLLSLDALAYGYNFFLGKEAESFQQVFLYTLFFQKVSAPSFIFSLMVLAFFFFLAGFLFSYFYTAQTLIYLLLRKSSDIVDIREVYFEEKRLDEFDAQKAGFVAASQPSPKASPKPSSRPLITPTEIPTEKALESLLKKRTPSPSGVPTTSNLKKYQAVSEEIPTTLPPTEPPLTNAPTVTPSAPTVTPSAPTVTPSAPTVTPSAPTVTPSAPAVVQKPRNVMPLSKERNKPAKPFKKGNKRKK